MTRQEENLKFDRVSQLKWLSDERFEVTYAGIKNAIDRSGEANSEHTEHPDLPSASVSPKARQLKII
jgi:hypothetical protein